MRHKVSTVLIFFVLSALNAAEVNHVVICWLKNPENTAERTKLVNASKKLASLEEVASVTVGERLSGNRPVVDSTYDIAIYMRFRDKKDLERYERNPQHQKALKEILIPLTSKVVIYDFVSL